MSDVINGIRQLDDSEIEIRMTHREVKRAFNFLSDELAGAVAQEVHLDTNHYRTFFSHFLSREYHYVLTWNEALRLHSYLRFYIERKKKNILHIRMSQIRNFPVYGLTVKGERPWEVKQNSKKD